MFSKKTRPLSFFPAASPPYLKEKQREEGRNCSRSNVIAELFEFSDDR